MNSAWLRYAFSLLKMAVKKKAPTGAFEYSITDAKPSGDPTNFSHPFHLVKKPISGTKSKFVWRGKKKPLEGSVRFTLLELQRELSEDLFCAFILRLATEQIHSVYNKDDYWKQETDRPTDATVYFNQIMERLHSKKSLPFLPKNEGANIPPAQPHAA